MFLLQSFLSVPLGLIHIPQKLKIHTTTTLNFYARGSHWIIHDLQELAGDRYNELLWFYITLASTLNTDLTLSYQKLGLVTLDTAFNSNGTQFTQTVVGETNLQASLPPGRLKSLSNSLLLLLKGALKHLPEILKVTHVTWEWRIINIFKHS